jgi:hypothetical protein
MAAARGAHSSTGQRRDFNQMERVRLDLPPEAGHLG